MRYPRHWIAHYQYFLQYHQRYSLQYATHASTSTTLPTLAHQPRSPSLPCHPRQHVNHVTQVSTPPTSPTQARHPRYPRQHATHATHTSTPPTLARIARHFSNSKNRMALKIISDLFCFVDDLYNLLKSNILRKKNNKVAYFGTRSLSFLVPNVWKLIPGCLKNGTSLTALK